MRPKRLLLTFIVIACILPALYFTAFQMRIPPRSTQIKYSDAPEETPSTSDLNTILSSLVGYMSPSDLARLRTYLRGVAPAAHTKEDPMGDYLWALSELTGNLTTIDSTLTDAKTAVASGNVQLANSDIALLNKLRSNSNSLLKTLYSSLTTIHSQYGVDTSEQSHAVTQFDARLQTDSAQIDVLTSSLNGPQVGMSTIVSMNVSTSNVLVGESFSFQGSLRQSNGTALGARPVTILWDTNQSTRFVTDDLGHFAGNLTYPAWTAAGETTITASFEPEGLDANAYLPSSTFVNVDVSYRPSSLTASVFPRSAKPSDSVQVTGSLSGQGLGPLQNRNVAVYLDERLLGNATTDSTGSFHFGFLLPKIVNGTHNVVVKFNPIVDLFAAANATVPINVTLLETQVLFQIRNGVFSGTTMPINGTVVYVNSFGNSISPGSGNVTIYFDNRPYQNFTLSVDGTFFALIQIPIETGFGSHNITVEYNATEPWITSSTSQATLTVYSTPILVAVAVGAVAVVASTLEYRSRKRKSRVVISLSQETQVKELATEEPSWQKILSIIHAEPEPTGKIQMAFNAAQTLVRKRIGESETPGETPEEFLQRATTTLPNITKPLSTIVELYELAEYSPFPIDDTQARKALENLTQIKAEIET
jgi:Domain of unknown function (DUF4129)